MSARETLERARAAYETAGKSIARTIALDVARSGRSMTILDLWGGGESARMFRSAIPDAAVVSAEVDEELWPVQLQDSQANGYVAHLGDAADAPGKYDLVWLDFCGQASSAMERTMKACAAKVVRGGTLGVTILPARESERLISGEARWLHLPLWMEGVTGFKVELLLPYRRDNGLPMWLVLLRPGSKSHFHDAAAFEVVRKAVRDNGYWSTIPLSPAARELLSQRGWVAHNTNDTDADLAQRLDAPDMGERRVLKMNELNSNEAALVRALIDAGEGGREVSLNTDWSGVDGSGELGTQSYNRFWSTHDRKGMPKRLDA